MAYTTAIKGDNIKLESFNEEYLSEDYLQWLKNTEINKYLLVPDSSFTLDKARIYYKSLIQSENDYFFAIIVANENKHIGNVRIGPISQNNRLTKVGLMIGNMKYHNIGIASKVLSLLKDFCFEKLKIHKIFADVINENIAAIKLFEKNGFVTEGLLKDHCFFKKKFHDLRIMGLINPND